MENPTRKRVNRLLYLLDLKAYESLKQELLEWRELEPLELGEDEELPIPNRKNRVETVQTIRTSKVTYQLEKIKCGKACKGCPHGPYWYAYWKEAGKTRTKYIGKKLTTADHKERGLTDEEIETWFSQVDHFAERLQAYELSQGR